VQTNIDAVNTDVEMPARCPQHHCAKLATQKPFVDGPAHSRLEWSFIIHLSPLQSVGVTPLLAKLHHVLWLAFGGGFLLCIFTDAARAHENGVFWLVTFDVAALALIFLLFPFRAAKIRRTASMADEPNGQSSREYGLCFAQGLSLICLPGGGGRVARPRAVFVSAWRGLSEWRCQ
jgi:hypothetical protein